MSDLIAFLEARVSEKERGAGEVHRQDCESLDPVLPYPCEYRQPERILREAAAMRQIAAHMTAPRMTASLDGLIVNGRFRTTGDHALRLLAAIWSGHPDYEEAWKP